MKLRNTLHRTVALAALAAACAPACGSKNEPSTSTGTGSGSARAPYVVPKDAPDGLDLRVSPGKQGPPAYDRATLAPAKKLADADANAMLVRANPIAKDPDDPQAFALRPGSQPAPRTGQTIQGTFPPAPSTLLPAKAAAAGGELKVLRWMPEGAVPLAPELSVTFSQPMIAVTSQSDAAATVPVKLTPTPPGGSWRWIGTRTIVFDPKVRFPQATKYEVEIPAGTKSATGGVLKTATKFAFETPPPKVVASFPPSHQPRHLNTPIFVLFDQKIDPKVVAANMKLTAGWTQVPLKLLEGAELAQLAQGATSARPDDKEVAALIEAAQKGEQDGRWLALRPAQALPADAQVRVEVGAGTRSAEGALQTKTAQQFEFRTYAPLRVVRAECGYGDKCTPGMPLVVEFNNPLDTDKFDDKVVVVSPDIPGLKLMANGSSVVVYGMTKARTTYKATLSSNLVDQFGQALGKDDTRTWSVGDAQPTFFGSQGIVVVDPAAKKPTLDVFSMNYDSVAVKLYKVELGDLDAFGRYMREQWNRDRRPPVPGKLVFDQRVATARAKNELAETHIDLAPALDKAGRGHAIAIVEPYPWKEQYEPPRMIAWVQATKLAVDAYVDATDLIAFATDLDTGKPAAGVELELRPFGTKAKTDDKGLATIPLSAGGAKGAHHLVARRGDDVAFVTEDGGVWNEFGTWTKQARPARLAWYVVDDRKLYKPGEHVSLKGWLRAVDAAKHGDIGLASAVTSVTYKVRDSRNNELATGTAKVSAAGGFDTKFTLPKTPNLGGASIEFVAAGGAFGYPNYYHPFQIEEFRRPEFEVAAKASQGPFLVGESGDVTVDAKYFAGGPLPGAPVSWTVTAAQTNFTPPNRDDHVFGDWQPWWGHHTAYVGDDGVIAHKEPKTWSLTGVTDATGAHTMHVDFLSVKPALPMTVTAHTSVMDVNRQAWSSSASMMVHPSQLYVGLKTKRPFVEKGTPFDIDVIGVDLDGKAVAGAKIEVAAVRLEWEYKRGKYSTKEVDLQRCNVQAAKDAKPCQFATQQGGQYQVTATIVDAAGRPNQTKLTFWVSGGDQPKARDVEQERVQIIPDKKEYAAGNTAELLVQAPFYPAEGVVSWRRSGIVKTERITIDGPTKVISVPITEAMVPNLHVQVDLVGMAARLDDKGQPDPKLPKRPAYAVGTISLEVPPKQRTLAIDVTPSAAKVGPGESVQIAVQVKDAAGKPVADAETAVIVVDEAILGLTNYQFPDPVSTLYSSRGPDARDHYLRAYVKLAQPDATKLAGGGGGRNGRDMGGHGTGSGYGVGGAARTAMAPSAEPMREMARKPAAPMEAAFDSVVDMKQEKSVSQSMTKNQDGQAPASAAIAIRSNFDPLAAFAPAVKTDAAGRATVSVKMPDNLTRYRIVAIATAGEKQFGKGESAVTARKPLMVRPSPPRFLNFGDKFQLPVVVQNQTDAPMTVRVAARTTNAALTDGAGREVVVPANDRVEVQFPAAAELAGTARFQFVGVAGAATDAAEVALPVWTPATTEAFATYGVIDDGAIKQPVALPGKVVTQFGGLEVTTASTNLQALTDAMLYLVRYPYECAEQRASRVFAVAALRDVLAAFKTKELPSAAAMETSVSTDIVRLTQLQNGDGGFAFWERGRPSEPYLTVYVTAALAHAQKKGYAVPAALLAGAKSYLQNIEQHYPHWYSKEVRWAISAYALYTRKQLGDLDIAKGQQLLRGAGGVEKVTMETNGWLLSLFAGNAGAAVERKAIVRHALNKVSETAGAANFTTSYGDGAYTLLASDRRVDSVMLEALIQEQKDLDLIPKVVTGLLGHRKAGRWLNTQENTFALVAMDLYFDTYEKATPDFVARVWLGNDYAGDHAFKGRTTEYFAIPIPMKDVATHDKQDLTIQKDGRGRLYYRVGMTYAPENLKLEPADYGFVVERKYEGADDPKDVTRLADGTWKIKAGSRVRVKLTMVNENRRYHVALVDPLPAGLEPMNPALAVTGPIPTDPKQQQAQGPYWWWYGPWYEHQNLRDERVEAFASLLWEGVHKYEYVARATTPGQYVVPPPKAEEMYMPETFGRGGSDRVIVE